MSSEPPDTLARDQRLQDVVLAYLKAIDAGQKPSEQELLARHPELMDDLRAFFSGQHKIQAGMAPLRGVLEQCYVSVFPTGNGLGNAIRVHGRN
jgi:hypothetical protein